ncbi:hypothetical protein ACO22_04593 [Paracoccidioides brasiliensis]|uniref:Uncharacterized protein n=1 Tax=Paracoccidioides brasiliensis TaxID=121759 RepID=A0A1D2JCT6_PARBR|nr:hypothetical protein ACO22_04593 [Paracoccidioides brasiliensis]ODH48094.1 hypothetical protein GX48_05780 [Paracoccidioides brasiliensis]
MPMHAHAVAGSSAAIWPKKDLMSGHGSSVAERLSQYQWAMAPINIALAPRMLLEGLLFAARTCGPELEFALILR